VRKTIQLLVGVAVSAALLYFAFRGTDWDAVAAAIAGARPAWIVVVIAASVQSVFVRALRWRILLRPVGDAPVYPAFSATAIGFGASAVFPFRVGEIVRPVLLARSTRIPLTAALSSVLLERLLDILLILTCFLLLSTVYPLPAEARQVARAAGAGFGIAFAMLIVISRQRARAEALLEWFLAWLRTRLAGALRPLSISFLDGLGALRDPGAVVWVLLYSVAIWGIITATFLFSFFALGVAIPYLPGALATVVLVAFTVAFPQLPGFVGGWQWGCSLALEGIFHVDHNVAVAYSLVTWIVQMAVNLGTAGFFLLRGNLSVGQMLRMAERAQETPGMEAK
jgi:uncharacterized protein (TIRG00374 family)